MWAHALDPDCVIVLRTPTSQGLESLLWANQHPGPQRAISPCMPSLQNLDPWPLGACPPLKHPSHHAMG